MIKKCAFFLIVCVMLIFALNNIYQVEGRPATATVNLESPEVMCRQPEMRGHCRALIMRWRYDAKTGKCYEFGFGGCDGNNNNFNSRKACMDACSHIR